MDRRLILLFVAFSLSCASLSAQLVQKGLALLQNSGKQPLAQVSLLVSGAAPATSDSRGQFNLHFATHKEGDQVRTIQIDKPGYELVNLKDVELWNLSATIRFVVVMCPKGALEESRRRYYKLGEDRYRRLYQEKLGELERALAEHNLQEKEYLAKMVDANRQLQRAMARLESFCDRFARINRDMLDELDKQALDKLDQGDVEGAIRVYEEARLLETFNQKRQWRDSLREEKTVIYEKIQEEIKLLEQEGSQAALARRDSLMQFLEENQPSANE